jgi:putative sigma-54 modulation protein
MKITIQTAGVTPHEPLKERIEKKLSKLETFYDKIVETAVHLKVENTPEKENKTTELIVKVPGDDIVVKKTCTSFEESLDVCVDIAKKLLIKKKELA